ncbi:MAG: polysaccharide deacetylase family protein [Nitrospirae bacterium]|nr:MAG: polysaccharide deacetylase family protein [Nitrospirota bacterium]
MLSRAGLKWVYFTGLAAIGRGAGLLRRIRRDNLVVVLNLHQVSPRSNPFWSPLQPRLFEDLLRFMKRHFDVITFGELAAARGSRPVAILSFDDGYYDFVEYAMPLLHKHGMRANQNIVPSCVESGRPPWNVQLSDFLNGAPRTLINELRLPGFAEGLAGDDVDSKTRYGVALSRFLKTRSRQERQPLWSRVEQVMEKADWTMTRMMSAADVRAAGASQEIGVHSYAHDSMEFESDAFFEEDLDRCVAYFEDILRMPLSIYAFPNGSYRPIHLEILRRRGISHILLVDEKFARRPCAVCPRFTMYGDSPAETRFRALGYYAQGVG